MHARRVTASVKIIFLYFYICILYTYICTYISCIYDPPAKFASSFYRNCTVNLLEARKDEHSGLLERSFVFGKTLKVQNQEWSLNEEMYCFNNFKSRPNVCRKCGDRSVTFFITRTRESIRLTYRFQKLGRFQNQELICE